MKECTFVPVSATNDKVGKLIKERIGDRSTKA